MYTYGRKQDCRISLDYTYKGMRVAFLENDTLRVGILLDKGADVFEFTYKPLDLDFMWQSPIPMQKPFISTSALPEGYFHDYFYGGWQEVLPSAGWATEPYQGTFQGLHGEASLLPFEGVITEDSPQRVELRAKIRFVRSPLVLERSMALEKDKSALMIRERLVNESEEEFAIIWGHHPSLGTPFLDENCVVQAPVKKVEVHPFHPNGLWEPGGDYEFPLVQNRRTNKLEDIRMVRDKTTRSVDVVFFKELSEGWYTITNEKKQVGFGMAWDARLFRYLWMWQVYGGHNDYPWYGRTYNVALEPFTSYPPAGVPNAIKNGTAYILSGNQVLETELCAVAFQKQNVKRILQNGSIE